MNRARSRALGAGGDAAGRGRRGRDVEGSSDRLGGARGEAGDHGRRGAVRDARNRCDRTRPGAFEAHKDRPIPAPPPPLPPAFPTRRRGGHTTGHAAPPRRPVRRRASAFLSPARPAPPGTRDRSLRPGRTRYRTDLARPGSALGSCPQGAVRTCGSLEGRRLPGVVLAAAREEEAVRVGWRRRTCSTRWTSTTADHTMNTLRP